MGETALYQAVEMENKEQIETLLSKGADPNISLGDGTTPLHCAVSKGNIAIAKVLLENGALPNSKTKIYLQTPLHLAIKIQSNEEIIKLLLDYNASSTLIDKFDKKPIDYVNDNKAIKTILSEAESSQLIKISQVSDTNNQLVSFLSKEDNKEKENNKEDDLLVASINPSLKDIISEVNHTENNDIINGSEKKSNINEEVDYKHVNTIQTPKEKNTNHININELLSANCNDNDNDNENENEEYDANEYNEEKENSYLNDSLDDNYNNNKSPSNKKKSDYVSDPLSSSKKMQREEENSLYKKIILAKRLNFNSNNKISYHKKSSNEPTLRDNYFSNQVEEQSKDHRNIASLNITPDNSNHQYDTNKNESNDNGHSHINLNKTTDNESNTKRGIDTNTNPNSNTHFYSSFSTQPQSANTNSLRIKKKYLDGNTQMLYQYNNDNENDDQYGKVSEFTIKNVTTRQTSSLQLSKMKKWLSSIDLIEHLNCFIDNEMCDIDRLKQIMINYDTKLKYSDIERIGIKKPGHIYRILTKLELDSHSIDEKVIQFILPNSNHNRTYSIETKFNLKISEEYCCGCSNFISKKPQLDLAMFLRRKTLQHLHPNFAHNGFDWLEYVLLQMFTDHIFKEEILENLMHIYNADDRSRLMKCLIEEMKKINLFVNSKEYMANPHKYKYASIDLEKEEQDKPCQTCIIY